MSGSVLGLVLLAGRQRHQFLSFLLESRVVHKYLHLYLLRVISGIVLLGNNVDLSLLLLVVVVDVLFLTDEYVALVPVEQLLHLRQTLQLFVHIDHHWLLTQVFGQRPFPHSQVAFTGEGVDAPGLVEGRVGVAQGVRGVRGHGGLPFELHT